MAQWAAARASPILIRAVLSVHRWRASVRVIAQVIRMAIIALEAARRIAVGAGRTCVQLARNVSHAAIGNGRLCGVTTVRSVACCGVRRRLLTQC